jgi:hypothetical protein
MPPLRKSKLQIEEEAVRGIRQRTAARVAQLDQAAANACQARERQRVVVDLIQEDRANEDRARQCEGWAVGDLSICVLGYSVCVCLLSFCSLFTVSIMPISKERPFKSPRQAKSKDVEKDSDEDDDIAIAKTLQKTHPKRAKGKQQAIPLAEKKTLSRDKEKLNKAASVTQTSAKSKEVAMDSGEDDIVIAKTLHKTHQNKVKGKQQEI